MTVVLVNREVTEQNILQRTVRKVWECSLRASQKNPCHSLWGHGTKLGVFLQKNRSRWIPPDVHQLLSTVPTTRPCHGHFVPRRCLLHNHSPARRRVWARSTKGRKLGVGITHPSRFRRQNRWHTPGKQLSLLPFSISLTSCSTFPSASINSK